MDIEARKKSLQQELDKLKREMNEELPKEIAEARELGDLKENAGYHAARERMAFVQAKIIQLMEQLGKLHSIDEDNIAKDKIGYGSTVMIVDVHDPDFSMKLTFVSESEADPVQGRISLSTPYGRTLAGKKIGEKVDVELPAGKKSFIIKYLKTIHNLEFSCD